MDKKFTIVLPYYKNSNKDLALLEFMCALNHATDMLKVYGQISLNEVVRVFHCTNVKSFSYRWGWDLRMDDKINVKVINNPANPFVCYLKFTARDIVG